MAVRHWKRWQVRKKTLLISTTEHLGGASAGLESAIRSGATHHVSSQTLGSSIEPESCAEEATETLDIGGDRMSAVCACEQ